MKFSTCQHLLLGLLSGLLLSGCSQSTTNTVDAEPAPVSHKVILDDRRYLLSLPPSFDKTKSYKLLLAFHGSGSNSRQMHQMASFARYSDDYIVVYPQSKVEEWNEGCECNKPHRLGVDDLGFVDKVIADVSGKYAIESGEVYAAGFSQGGLFTQNLLCNRAETFKAIASVGAPMSKPLSQSCELTQPTSFMMVHGKADAVLPYRGKPKGNFALLGSEQAIELIAEKNKSLSQPLHKTDGNVEQKAFWNGQQKTHLYAIDGGKHHWSHPGFNTSKMILDFFDSAHRPELPLHSTFVNVEGTRLHVRIMGEDNGKPAVVMLSGPNKNFHADSAWFALIQQRLAQQYKVIVIDRPGNGFSEFDENTSYRAFSDKLHQALLGLDVKEVVFAGFASANISLVEYLQRYGNGGPVQVKGMLWIDPDVLMPYSIAFYQDYPVTFYREKRQQLLPHLATGAWTERTLKKLAEEREEVVKLVDNSMAEMMDWAYFDALSQQRILVDRQQTRAIEIANYYDDLAAMTAFEFITHIPVSVIDSDFEKGQIKAFPDAAEKLTRWMEEGTAWSKLVAEKSGGQYIPLENATHMVPFEHPETIVTALEQLMNHRGIPRLTERARAN